MLTMIAAAAENNALGENNQLLWHLPDDFKRFKRLTTGHSIIMGRKTFESFPKLLPKRNHIVITRQQDFKAKNVSIAHSLEEALKMPNIGINPFIIGGGQIYRQALPLANKIELTRVHGNFEADTYFPEFKTRNWNLVGNDFHEKDKKHKYSFSYLTYERNS